jgi:hypothetical protein
MEKNVALVKILNTIENVRLIDTFDGKKQLLKKLNNLYDMVDLHFESMNYNELCVSEAEALFTKIMGGLKYE